MPDPIEQLARDLGIQIENTTGLQLVRAHDAVRIVQRCKLRGVLILGCEAFTLENGRVHPHMDLIADFSELVHRPWNLACHEAARSAEIYLDAAERRPDLWFELVLSEHEPRAGAQQDGPGAGPQGTSTQP